jgi:ribonuclease HI
MVKQLNGEYRVRNRLLKALYTQAETMASAFKKVSYTHIRREKNEEADGLANEALDKAFQ